MDFNKYQKEAKKTAFFPSKFEGRVFYPAIGLSGEVGELMNKIQKMVRDSRVYEKEDIAKELGDILWYLSQVAEEFGIDMDYIAELNLKKLADRQNRGKLGGDGDNR